MYVKKLSTFDTSSQLPAAMFCFNTVLLWSSGVYKPDNCIKLGSEAVLQLLNYAEPPDDFEECALV